MRFFAGLIVAGWLIGWQAAACWAIGPMGFSDPPPEPSSPLVRAAQSLIPTTDMGTDGTDACGSCDCQACGGHRLGSCLKCGIFCNMPQHYAYPSPWDRYYYFRPYNYFQVTQLQQTVTAWGQDPRNISDNRFFQAIYDEVDSAGKRGPDGARQPKPEPVPAPAPVSASPAEKGRPNPVLSEPALKLTHAEAPTEVAPSAARLPATSAERSNSTAGRPSVPSPDGGTESRTELIRFLVP